MRKSRFCLGLLAALCLFAGCGETDSPETDVPEASGTEPPVESEPQAETEPAAPADERMMKQFDITFFYGPTAQQMTDETIVRDMAECGFTAVPLSASDADVTREAFTLMQQYGLRCSALHDHRIYGDRIRALAESEQPQETADETVRQVLTDYADCSIIDGFDLKDEPNTDFFPALAYVVDAFRRLSPESAPCINLYPTYANAEQLGAPSYETYVTDFINTVNPPYLSYDHYHFFSDGTARPGYFTNLEIVRQAALDSGIPAMQIILLTKHGPYADLTAEQIRWEVAMDLAYGMKRISYFTYMLPDDSTFTWSNAIVDRDGHRLPHYDMVKAVNEWAKPIGDELFGKTSTAVFHTEEAEEGCTLYESYGDLGAIRGKRFVIGFFDDGSFMIVNKTATGKHENKLTLLDVTDGLECFDPTDAAWKSADECAALSQNQDGQYVLALLPGDGVLMKVKKV